MALVKGSAPTVLLHLRRGAGLRDRDDRGLTPLMLAASAGRQDICTLLIAEGADRADRAPDGQTAAGLAARSGHHALASLLEVSDTATTRDATAAFGEFEAGDWEAEEEIAVGASACGLLESVRLAQAGLGRANADTAPDWSDIELVLPARVPERTLSPALRRWISETLQGLRSPGEVRAVCRRLPGLAALMEDAGVRLVDDPLDRWVQDRLNLRSWAERNSHEGEVVEAVEALLHPRDSDSLRRAEIDRVPRLDRATEQSMFRALEEARRSVLRALLASATMIEPASNSAEEEMTEPDEGEPELDFVSSLLDLKGLAPDEAMQRLNQLDLDIPLVERIIEGLASRGNPAGAALRLQLNRYLSARDRVVSGGLPWVEPVARRYQRPGVELGDLCQAGAIGLMRAAERFDPSFGYRFQTFAAWWIRQACGRLVADQAQTIRVPVHVQEARARYIRARATLQAGGIGPPDFAQIAKKADLSPEAALRSLRPRRQVSLSRPDLEAWAARRPSPDDDPGIELLQADRRRWLGLAVADLSEREADIVRRRFGLEGFDPMTLEEVGGLYRITRERIRQVESKALKRLGRGPRGRQLRELL